MFSRSKNAFSIKLWWGNDMIKVLKGGCSNNDCEFQHSGWYSHTNQTKFGKTDRLYTIYLLTWCYEFSQWGWYNFFICYRFTDTEWKRIKLFANSSKAQVDTATVTVGSYIPGPPRVRNLVPSQSHSPRKELLVSD